VSGAPQKLLANVLGLLKSSLDVKAIGGVIGHLAGELLKGVSPASGKVSCNNWLEIGYEMAPGGQGTSENDKVTISDETILGAEGTLDASLMGLPAGAGANAYVSSGKYFTCPYDSAFDVKGKTRTFEPVTEVKAKAAKAAKAVST
jgi:hypothetical protein